MSLFDPFWVSSKPQSGRLHDFRSLGDSFSALVPCGPPCPLLWGTRKRSKGHLWHHSRTGTRTDSKQYRNKPPKAFKSSGLETLWRTVSNLCGRFLENNKYAIRSCLCSPNSIPSTPDTPHNELKTHSWEHVNTNSVPYQFQKLFYLKSGPQEPVNLDSTRTGKYFFFTETEEKKAHKRRQ